MAFAVMVTLSAAMVPRLAGGKDTFTTTWYVADMQDQSSDSESADLLVLCRRKYEAWVGRISSSKCSCHSRSMLFTHVPQLSKRYASRFRRDCNRTAEKSLFVVSWYPETPPCLFPSMDFSDHSCP